MKKYRGMKRIIACVLVIMLFLEYGLDIEILSVVAGNIINKVQTEEIQVIEEQDTTDETIEDAETVGETENIGETETTEETEQTKESEFLFEQQMDSISKNSTPETPVISEEELPSREDITEKEENSEENPDEEEEEGKEEGEEIEVTEEEIYAMSMGNALFTAEDIHNRTAGIYTITCYQEWLNLCEASQTDSLTGLRFQYTTNMYASTTGGDNESDVEWNLNKLSGFVGIGSEDFPFEGELYSIFEEGTISINVNRTLFNYISPKAKIYNVKINAYNNTAAGLADYLVMDEGAEDTIFSTRAIEINTISGHIIGLNSVKPAGGLIGTVINHDTTTPLTIRRDVEENEHDIDNYIKINGTIQGIISGGLIGETKGKVVLELDPKIVVTRVEGRNGNPVNYGGVAPSAGGLVGKVSALSAEGVAENTFELKGGNGNTSYTMTHVATNPGELAYGNQGGLFGSISDTTVMVNHEITYKGGASSYDFYARNAGAFAGLVERSKIVLNRTFTSDSVRLQQISPQLNTYDLPIGSGLFVGAFFDSVVEVGDEMPENAKSLYLSTPTSWTDKYSFTGRNKNDYIYNSGGLAGYAKNTDFIFTKSNPCVVSGYYSYKKNGTDGGAIGLYEAIDTAYAGRKNVIQYIDVRDNMRSEVTNVKEFATGGLIGKVKLTNRDLIVSDYRFQGNLICKFGGANSTASMGIGMVKTGKDEQGNYGKGKLTFQNFTINGTLKPHASYTSNQLGVYGGAIGILDADLVITSKKTDNENSTEEFINSVQSNYNDATSYSYYVGGLTAKIVNSDWQKKKRTVSVENVAVGGVMTRYLMKSTGGLFATTDKNTAVCLDGKIWMNGGEAGNSFDDTVYTLEPVMLYYWNGYAVHMGTILGEQDNSLIYIQPTADIQMSEQLLNPEKVQCQEIGNYGGVIRNGYYDTADLQDEDRENYKNDESKWLIQDFTVTGTLDVKRNVEVTASQPEENESKRMISTYSDWMRLAIMMNTGGVFLPKGNVGENIVYGMAEYSQCYEMLRSAQYAITMKHIDMSEYETLGIFTMGRNDETGMVTTTARAPYSFEPYSSNIQTRDQYSFKGSLEGVCENKTRITYGRTSYYQRGLSLFPYIDGGTVAEANIMFKNLELGYKLQYGRFKAVHYNNVAYEYFSIGQETGGLAAIAKGNITLSGIKYGGLEEDTAAVIEDNDITTNNTTARYWREDSLGGLIGRYVALPATTVIEMKEIKGNIDFTYSDNIHVMGGVIGYVETYNGYNKVNIQMSDVDLTGEIELKSNKYSYDNGTEAEPYFSGRMAERASFFITYIGSAAQGKEFEATETMEYAFYCNMNISDLNIHDVRQVRNGKTAGEKCGGFLGYDWRPVDATFTRLNVATGMSELKNNGQFGGLVHTVYGAMRIKEGLNMGEDLIIDACSSSYESALLIYDGKYLYLDIEDYEPKGITLKNYKTAVFDELVGETTDEDSDCGGIVSLGYSEPEKRHLQPGTAYRSYPSERNIQFQGCVSGVSTANEKTRYYYDLNKISFTGNFSLIQNEQDLMKWSVLQYARKFLRRAMAPNYTIPTQVTVVSGIELDMTGYSFYPAVMTANQVFDGKNATIKLAAKEINQGEDAVWEDENGSKNHKERYTSVLASQHNGLQSGLIQVIDGVSVTVKNLKMTGTYSQLADSYIKITEYVDEETNEVKTNQETIIFYSGGAIVSSEIRGKEKEATDSGKVTYDENVICNFEGIVFQDLECISGTGRNTAEETGLMIAHIVSGATVNIKTILVDGYEERTGSSEYLFSALIDRVGGETYTTLKTEKELEEEEEKTGGEPEEEKVITYTNMLLNFEDMELPDKINSGSYHNIFKYATLIRSYDYTEGSSAIYTFTEAEYKYGEKLVTQDPSEEYHVTLGNELGATESISENGKKYGKVQYMDNERFVGQLPDEEEQYETGMDYREYLRYVCASVYGRNIIINPKTENIENGCGTYEDPYIISTTEQFITLYHFMYHEREYTKILQGWKINEIGNDDELCKNDNHGVIIYSTPVKNDGETEAEYEKRLKEYKDKIKSIKNRLSQAYYMISGDIDVTGYPEFVGFGTASMPFIGVFVGKECTDGTEQYPVITMSKQVSTMNEYGLIRNAKGCVVKNLNVKYDETIKVQSVNGVPATAGSVIGCIMGGDNIIDHVKVLAGTKEVTTVAPEGETPESVVSYVQVPVFHVQDTLAKVGGYVGVIEKGGLIIRNMEDECNSLKQFELSYVTRERIEADPENNIAGQSEITPASYKKVSGIVGWVEDGYVIYEDTASAVEVTTPDTPCAKFEYIAKNSLGDYYDSSELKSCKNYDILYGNYLELCIQEEGGTDYTAPTTDTIGTYNIHNAAELLVMSMALNTGMLNYDATSTGSKNGYNSTTRERSAEYTNVGNVSTDTDEDYLTAVQKDNKGVKQEKFHSYLMKYFGDSFKESTCDIKAKAQWNTEKTTYDYLLTGKTYDLSIYGKAFRGFGAWYHKNDNKNLMHSNIRGVNQEEASKLIYSIHADSYTNVQQLGFISEITDNADTVKGLTYENLILNGTIKNSASNPTKAYNASGFLCKAKGKYTFRNVIQESMEVTSKYLAAGLVADGTETTELFFYDCGIRNNREMVSKQNTIHGYSDAGGFLAYSNTAAVEIKGIRCIEYLEVCSGYKYEDINHKMHYYGNNAAGLVARCQGTLYISGTSDEVAEIPVGNHIKVSSYGHEINVSNYISSGVQIGGLVGSVFSGTGNNNDKNVNYLTVENVAVKNLSVENLYGGKYTYVGLDQYEYDMRRNVDTNKKLLEPSGATNIGYNIAGTGGIVGSANGTINMSNIIVGTEDENDKVSIKNENPMLSYYRYDWGGNAEWYFGGSGGLIGYQHGNSKLNINNCSVLGTKKDDTYTTEILAYADAGAVTNSCWTTTANNILVQGVSVQAMTCAGGFSGRVTKDYMPVLTDIIINDVKVEAVWKEGFWQEWKDGEWKNTTTALCQLPSSKAIGHLGGVIGRLDGGAELYGVQIENLIIPSCNSIYAGGMVGRLRGWNTLKVKPYVIEAGEGGNPPAENRINSVKNSYVAGRMAGGIAGYIENPVTMEEASIENNKIITACKIQSSNDDNRAAGALFGWTEHKDTIASPLYGNNLTVRNNFISGYRSATGKDGLVYLGGLVGRLSGRTYFYHTVMEDNYIGVMPLSVINDASGVNAEDYDQNGNMTDAVLKKNDTYIQNTDIKPPANGTGTGYLRELICRIEEKDGTYKPTQNISNSPDNDCIKNGMILEECYYQYCYYQGLLTGSEIGTTRLIAIDLNVSYEEEKYRPVTDVGFVNKKFTSNDAMYLGYQDKSHILYGVDTEKTSPVDSATNVPQAYQDGVSPYVFGEVENIFQGYENEPKDKDSFLLNRNIFRHTNGAFKDFSKDNKRVQVEKDGVTTTETVYHKTIQSLYEATYKDENGYKTPYQYTDGTKVPLIVYDSTVDASLNEVVQTYVNLLTNNAGGLGYNLKTSDNANWIYKVEAYKVKFENDTFTFVNNPCVTSSHNNTSGVYWYNFTNTTGDALIYDADENVIGGTFTLLRFKYCWNGNVEYTLDLPIYIQQRLKVDTHMAITADIQYQTDVLKSGESHKVSEARTVLVTGESYSIYSEYIYNEIPTSLKEARLPKILEISDGHRFFEKGTKLTMFSLMENSEPYYYEVTNNNGLKKIDMADFKNANGENYEIKNLGYLMENNTKASYKDIHNGKYNSSVVVEQFVVLVDTSNARRVEERQIYGVHFSGKDIQKTGNKYTDLQVSNRLDYNEDCNVNIMEVPGFNFEIDEEGKNSDESYATKIGTSSYIGDTGTVDVDLQYKLEIDIAYLTRGYATRQNEIKRYVDVAYSLAVKDGSDVPLNISLPKGLKMTFQDDEEDIVYITEEEKDVFYYYKESKKQDELCINDLSVSELDMETGRDRSVGIGTFKTDVILDFSSVDSTMFDKYSKDAEFYVVANLVTYTEEGMPEAGVTKDDWKGNVMLEVESEIGLSITVEDTEKLGINRYRPTESDDGVINYITGISFPESYGDEDSGLSDVAANKYYTIVYEIQEKTVGADGEIVYKTYTGDDITIYPGRLDWEDVNTVTVDKPILSKSGIQAVTYQFTPEQIENGIDLIDGIREEESEHQNNAIIATHCTVMVNPEEDINMTNYRVNAYLIITDNMPDVVEHSYGGENAMLKGYTLREINSTGANLIVIEDLKNVFETISDYIVFTVAKVKVFD